eukprot:14980477-Ditylum_brightwellii.AAC.1
MDVTWVLCSFIQQSIAKEKPLFSYDDEQIVLIELQDGINMREFLDKPASEWVDYVSDRKDRPVIVIVVWSTALPPPRPVINPFERMANAQRSKSLSSKFSASEVDE